MLKCHSPSTSVYVYIYIYINYGSELPINNPLKYIKVHTATRWTIRQGLMLLWFTDLMNVTEEVTTHRPNILTLLSSAFIRDDLNAATIGPFIWSLISSLSMTSWHSFKSWQWWFASWCLFTPPQKKRPLIGDHIKGPLVAVFRSPLMKALNRSVETLGLWIVTSSVTLIKSVNQSSIKPCLTILC